MKKFYRIVEICEPPNFDELEAAGESILQFENVGGDHRRGRAEIIGKIHVLLDLLETQFFGDARFNAPFFWHFAPFFKVTPDRAGNLRSLAEHDAETFGRYFGDLQMAWAENQRYKELVDFLGGELRILSAQMKSAAAGA